ncbi:MAG: hypothetical protein JW829_12555 [Pirellulales bacterium]|nr:hypothetical protein [Pirellulales bacterium]
MIHQECDTLKPSDPKNRGLRAVHEKRRVRQKVCYDMGRWRQKTTIELHATDIIPPAEAARPDAHASDGGQEEWLEKEIFAESARVYEPQYDTWRNQDYAYRVFGFDVREDLHEASGVQHLADKIRITFIMRDESTLRIDLNPDNFYITDAEARDKEGHLLARHSRVKTYFKPSGEFFVLGFEQRTYRFVNGKCELVSKMIQDASCKALNESISDRLLSEDVDDSAPW